MSGGKADIRGSAAKSRRVPSLRSADKIDQFYGIGRLIVAAPRDMLIGAYQHELPRIVRQGIGSNIQHNERKLTLSRRLDDSRNAHSGIGTDECVAMTQLVIKRQSTVQPQMRQPTARNR